MSFESNIPKYLKECDLAIQQLYVAKDRLQLGNDGHDCDCEYCERRGENAKDANPDDLLIAEKIDEDIQAYQKTINRIKSWQNFVNK